MIFVLQVLRYSRFRFGKESFTGALGLGVPRRSVSLGGSEAFLGVHVSATDCFAVYTMENLYVFVISPRATTLIGGHLSFTTVEGFGLELYTVYTRNDTSILVVSR